MKKKCVIIRKKGMEVEDLKRRIKRLEKVLRSLWGDYDSLAVSDIYEYGYGSQQEEREKLKRLESVETVEDIIKEVESWDKEEKNETKPKK